VHCFKSNDLINGKIRIVLFPIYLVNNIPKSRKYTWMKESRILKHKLEKRDSNDNEDKNFYCKREMKINSIKAEFYDKNKFEESSDFKKTLLLIS